MFRTLNYSAILKTNNQHQKSTQVTHNIQTIAHTKARIFSYKPLQNSDHLSKDSRQVPSIEFE